MSAEISRLVGNFQEITFRISWKSVYVKKNDAEYDNACLRRFCQSCLSVHAYTPTCTPCPSHSLRDVISHLWVLGQKKKKHEHDWQTEADAQKGSGERNSER